MGDETKHEAFRVYRERKVLVSIDEMESMRRRLPAGMAYDGRVDIYPHKPLEYRTIESLSRID